MSEVSKEQLSALLDGELAGDEVRFLLRRIQADPALAEVWARYQLIGDSMRRQVAMPVTSAFALRVMQQIKEGQAEAAQPRSSRHGRSWRWVRYGLGGSIAASVAVAALVWMQPRQNLPASPAVAEQSVSRDAPALADQGAAPVVAAQPVATAVPDMSAWLRQPGAAGLNVQPASALRSGQPLLMQAGASELQPVWMSRSSRITRHDPETFYLRRTSSGPPREAAEAQMRPH